MIRLIILMLSFSSACIAAPTKQLIILTTFTESSITPITQQFQQQYPDAVIKVLHRREESGLRLLSKNDHDIDIVISSSPTLFMPLIENNRLLPLDSLNQNLDNDWHPFLPGSASSIAVFGYSGYGLMWNKDYLIKHRLDIPQTWESLAEPQYFRHLIMSSPGRSGTTHLMVENILQQYGWTDGWKLLLQIGGNLASVSARSFGVSDAISRGLTGVGPVIDSFAFEDQKQFPFIGFHYQEQSPRLPSYIAAVKNRHQARHSLDFIGFLLSDNVQQSLSTSSLNKYGLHQKPSQPFTVLSIDYEQMQHRTILIKLLFDQIINHQLDLLNQAWRHIHQLARQPSLTDTQQQQYQRAIALASTPPVTEAQANNTAFNQALIHSQTDVHTAKSVKHWRRVMSKQLEESILISEQLLAAIKEVQ